MSKIAYSQAWRAFTTDMRRDLCKLTQRLRKLVTFLVRYALTTLGILVAPRTLVAFRPGLPDPLPLPARSRQGFLYRRIMRGGCLSPGSYLGATAVLFVLLGASLTKCSRVLPHTFPGRPKVDVAAVYRQQLTRDSMLIWPTTPAERAEARQVTRDVATALKSIATMKEVSPFEPDNPYQEPVLLTTLFVLTLFSYPLAVLCAADFGELRRLYRYYLGLALLASCLAELLAQLGRFVSPPVGNFLFALGWTLLPAYGVLRYVWPARPAWQQLRLLAGLTIYQFVAFAFSHVLVLAVASWLTSQVAFFRVR